MQKLVFVLVVAALALAVWQTLEASRLRADLDAQELETRELRADLARLSSDLQALDARASAEPFVLPAPEAGAAAGAAGDDPSLAGTGAAPEVIARQVRDLQDRVARVEGIGERVEEIEEKVEKRPAVSYRAPTMIRDLASAAVELDLTSAQHADVERIVDWTKRELDDLYNTPNEEGKTLKDVSESTVKTAGEGVTLVLPNFAEQAEFRNSKIPGSNETFGEAEQRIRSRGKREVRDVLTPEQQKTWDKSITDPLFGSRGGGMFGFSTVHVETRSTQGED